VIVNAELLAFARGYAEGCAGTDRLPYHQIDEADLVKIYYLGRAHGQFDGAGVPLPSEPDDTPELPLEAAVPIRAKTGK